MKLEKKNRREGWKPERKRFLGQVKVERNRLPVS
jgi:hypothetical protein